MSFAIDVNILLYTSDEVSPFASRARAFLDDCAAGREVLCVAWTTVMSYLRIATHPAIFASPLAPDEAMRNIEALLHLPHVRLLSEEQGFWDVYRTVTQRRAIRGNLQEAIADGVGQGRLAEVVVPLGGRELARDDGGAAAVAVFEDLEQIAALLIMDGGEAAVVEDEDVEAGELGEQADVGAVGAGQGEVVEEARGPTVARAIAFAAGLVRQRAGDGSPLQQP